MENDKSNPQRVARTIGQGYHHRLRITGIISKIRTKRAPALTPLVLKGTILYGPWLFKGGASELSQPIVRLR